MKILKYKKEYLTLFYVLHLVELDNSYYHDLKKYISLKKTIFKSQVNLSPEIYHQMKKE